MQDEVNPERSRFDHCIIYNKFLHETGMENTHWLEIIPPAGTADYLQTVTNQERDECEHKICFKPVSVALSASEQRMLNKAL